jgi:hypothetical protein
MQVKNVHSGGPRLVATIIESATRSLSTRLSAKEVSAACEVDRASPPAAELRAIVQRDTRERQQPFSSRRYGTRDR